MVNKAAAQEDFHEKRLTAADRLIGSSPVMRKVLSDITVVATAKTSVLITGESGTGKEMVARSIHERSDRTKHPLVKVNCSAIPADLLESELFGHVKGSFTGAVSNRTGSFQKADGGTLFLDEIGDLPIQLQPKLLHAVEDKTVTPVGSSTSQKIDVKIISASNRDFDRMIRAGEFRKDLYFRLNTFTIHLPELNRRLEDIDELAQFFIKEFARELNRPVTGISPDAIDRLKSHKWPGNVRELKNVIERAMLTCESSMLDDRHLPADLGRTNRAAGTALSLAHKEKQLICEALQKTAGNQVRAAKLLGISRNTLRYRLKKYNIDSGIYKL